MVKIGLDKSKDFIYKKTRKDVLEMIKPSSKQIIQDKKFVDLIIKKIEHFKGSHISAIVAGSIGKNTYIKDSVDFDIFVLYPPSLKKENFIKEGLIIGEKVFKGYFWEKTYSQHPYIRGVIDGKKVEIIPAYKIDVGENIISAVDRTSLHLFFINKNMSNYQKDDVRILKYFLKKIDCYGADSSINGFSGYLCELLILFYGSFINLLEHSVNWSFPIKFVLLKEQEPFLNNFSENLVVIDPVDSNRNVASAVSDSNISKFISASRVFIENPNIDFFKKRVVNQMTYHQLIGRLNNFPLGVICFNVKNLLKEVSFSKIKKNITKLIKYLEINNFYILKNDIYLDEENSKAYFIFMFDKFKIPKFYSAIGPKITDFINSEKFINNSSGKGVLGPFIKDDRWYEIRQRDRVDIKSIILNFLFSNFDIPSKLYIDKEISDLYLKEDILSIYFSDFFISKEKFLF
ncbi:MAG: CCA tRNA nucleotidyltransferase [Candidatus ainarchaeum sp.]|nr:CCA tRNA nucleotidyltransferase [Candidatus ainarchaeum sp.]MDD3975987.1 CCA tRNA nucleotidyltransferase [Candidatus ainarchaeum sp.]